MSTQTVRNRRAAIAGIGSTPMLRKADDDLGTVAATAALAAIEDAGLTVDDIDGYIGCPTAPNASARHEDGVDEVSAGFMVQKLGLRPRWAQDVRGLPPTAVERGVQALLAGECTTLLFVRAMYNPTGVRYAQMSRPLISGPDQFTLPYGLGGAGGRHSLWLQRYMYDHGATREDLFQVVQNARQNAQLNPIAHWRGRPLTLDDYLQARWIYKPMCLFDCDIPVTAAGALVLTTADRARDLQQPPAFVSAIVNSQQAAGSDIFQALGVERTEVQVAQIYDGYSHFVWFWLEALGICGPGEAHEFTRDGRINLGGAFPLNTFGGNLGEGRLHGFGHVREGALQVMGRAGQRQAGGVRNCLVAVGVGYPGSTTPVLLLSAE